jgi:hypothetical protein
MSLERRKAVRIATFEMQTAVASSKKASLACVATLGVWSPWVNSSQDDFAVDHVEFDKTHQQECLTQNPTAQLQDMP